MGLCRGACAGSAGILARSFYAEDFDGLQMPAHLPRVAAGFVYWRPMVYGRPEQRCRAQRARFDQRDNSAGLIRVFAFAARLRVGLLSVKAPRAAGVRPPCVHRTRPAGCGDRA